MAGWLVGWLAGWPACTLACIDRRSAKSKRVLWVGEQKHVQNELFGWAKKKLVLELVLDRARAPGCLASTRRGDSKKLTTDFWRGTHLLLAARSFFPSSLPTPPQKIICAPGASPKPTARPGASRDSNEISAKNLQGPPFGGDPKMARFGAWRTKFVADQDDRRCTA